MRPRKFWYDCKEVQHFYIAGFVVRDLYYCCGPTVYTRVVASTQSFKYKYQYLSLKYQYQYQYPCLKYKYKYQYFGSKYQHQYKYLKMVLKYRSSTSTSTQYYNPGVY